MDKLNLIFKGIWGYLHVVLFPILISMIVGVVLYLNLPDEAGIVVALFLGLCGLITGLIMALRVFRKRGVEVFTLRSDSVSDEPEQSEEDKI